MADIQKLIGSESPLEVGQKINEIIDNTGGTGLDNKITNCITEVPQRIKYTLESGTLTIKAGSVVIVPYGTEDLTAQYPRGATFINDNYKVVDTQFNGGKFFVWVEIQSDIAKNPTVTDKATRHVEINLTNNGYTAVSNTTSSATQFSGTGNNMNYRTDLNIMQYTGSGTLTSQVASLPILTTPADGTYVHGSIDQVFNGFGYIGSTIWADKGIKGLAPNGRNEDGSLNNIEWTSNSLTTFTNTGTNKNSMYITYWADNQTIGHAYPPYSTFDEINNIWIYNNAVRKGVVVGSYKESGTTGQVISEFETKQPFRAMDYNEAVVKSSLKECQVIVETYANGTSWYRIWSDGWKEQGGLSSNIGVDQTVTITLLKAFSNTNYSILCNWLPSGTYSIDDNPIPNTKTTTNFKIRGTGYGANDGYSLPAQWYACGF